MGLHQDEVIEGYQELTDLLHRYDVKVIAQLIHCGRQGTPEVVGETPIAPSAVANILGITPVAMDEDQILEAIHNFIRAAERAKLAGFDGVQIHAAHGYLIHEFLSPRTNLRQDDWGGSFEKRIKFLTDIYQGIRRRVGKDYPVMLRINANDYLENGLGIQDAVRIAQQMSSLGIDALDISAGTWETHFYMSRGDIPKNYWLYARTQGEEREKIGAQLSQIAHRVKFKEAYLLEYAREMKKKVHCPLILAGG